MVKKAELIPWNEIEERYAAMFKNKKGNIAKAFGALEDILLIDAGQKVIHFTSDEAANYAVALRGKREAVEALVGGQKVLHREEFAHGEIYWTVQNNFTQEKTTHMIEAGIELLPVATDDLCVYLTGKDKGGIDSVFGDK